MIQPQTPKDYAQERRSSFSLLQYWNFIRGDREMPSEDEIDPDALQGLWPNCFLVQVRDIEAVQHFNYTYFGDALRQAYSDAVLNEDNTRVPGPEANRLAAIYRSIIESCDPLLDENELVNARGQVVLYRQSMMPLGRQEGKVESILGGVWFRISP